MKNKFIYLLTISIFIVSCKKKEFETLPTSNSPVFTLDGTFDGESMTFNAGVNGFEMKSNIAVLNGVKYAFGEFTDGDTRVKIGLFDGRLGIPTNDHPFKSGDSMLFAGKQLQPLAYLSANQMSNSSKIANIKWYANGLAIGENNVNMKNPGVYDVRGDFTFTDGVKTSITNKMYLGYEDKTNFSIRHFLSDFGELKLWIEGNSNPVDSIQWYLNDNYYLSTGATCTSTIPLEMKKVKAKVFYQNGAIREKVILVDGSYSGHFIEDFSVFKMPDPERFWDYNVGIEIVKNGAVYTSFETLNKKSRMVIKNYSFYNHPTTGNQLIRIEAEIDTKLKSLTSGGVISTELNVVFAIPLTF